LIILMEDPVSWEGDVFLCKRLAHDAQVERRIVGQEQDDLLWIRANVGEKTLELGVGGAEFRLMLQHPL